MHWWMHGRSVELNILVYFDAKSGYWQIPVRRDHQWLTACAIKVSLSLNGSEPLSSHWLSFQMGSEPRQADRWWLNHSRRIGPTVGHCGTNSTAWRTEFALGTWRTIGGPQDSTHRCPLHNGVDAGGPLQDTLFAAPQRGDKTTLMSSMAEH